MPGCANGAELIQKLRGTGTPDGQLAGARQLLADVHRVENGRIATANEVMVALETGEYQIGDQTVTITRAQPGTMVKVRELVRTGVWTGQVAEKAVPIEDRLLAPTTLPASSDADAPPTPPAPESAAPAADSAAPLGPGVHPTESPSVSGVVGPKAVAKPAKPKV